MLKKLLFLFGSLFVLILSATAQLPNENGDRDDSINPPIESLSPEEQAQRQKEAEEAAEQACAACGGGMMLMMGLAVAAIVLNIALLVWVARDAKNRSMDSAVLWMLLVMFTGLIGFLIYILSRPQGQLAQCPSCNNKRLAASAQCPHCHNA